MNQKKNLALVALLAIHLVANASTITFKAKNAGENSRSALMFPSSPQPQPLAFNAEGQAQYEFNESSPQYVKFYFGKSRTPKLLYLDSTKDLTVSFDAQAMDSTIQFIGSTSQINAYLNGGELKSLSYKDCNIPEADFMKKTDDLYNSNCAVLAKYRLDPSFVKLETARLKYSTYEALLNFPRAYQYMTKDAAYQPSQAFYDKVKSLYVEDAALLTLPEYQSFLQSYIYAVMPTPTADNADNFTVSMLEYIDAQIKDSGIKEFLVYNLVKETISYNGLENSDKLLEIFHKNVTAPTKVDEIKALCAKWEPLKPGNLSPSFTCQDINGKTVSLADLKGKFIYIDVWATWCGPCRGELPHLKKLEKEYGEKDICFVSISCDKNKKAWETMVAKEELKGVQLIFGEDDSFSKQYMITGIPRFILLDREGKILKANAPRPSSPATAKLFDELLTK